MAKLYKIFVSHSWTHVNDLKLLKNLLESRGYFNVEFTEFPPTDYINSTNTYYVRQRIAERISASNIVIGIADLNLGKLIQQTVDQLRYFTAGQF